MDSLSHVNRVFYSCLLLSEAYLTLVRLFQRVWLVRCENARPSLRSTERLNRLQLDCFVFGCFFFLTVIVSCIETKFSGVSSHIISNLYTKHSAPLSSPHLLWCIFIPGVPDVHVNLCWREPCFQHEQVPSFDAVDADVKRYFDIIMSAAV